MAHRKQLTNQDSALRKVVDTKNPSPPDALDATERDLLKQKIEAVLKTLTGREREFIKIRYGIGDGYTYTIEEATGDFKVTRDRVRDVQPKSIRKLQRSRKLPGFKEKE